TSSFSTKATQRTVRPRIAPDSRGIRLIGKGPPFRSCYNHQRSQPPTGGPCETIPIQGACNLWCGQAVSVILPTYNERDSIRASIADFFNTGVVDEVIVINNNAADG